MEHLFVCLFVSVPSVPLAVSVSPEGMLRSLLVTWSEPLPLNAPTVNYTVFVGQVGMSPGDRMEYRTGPDELSFLVPGLSPYTNYSVSVMACSMAGCGPESDPIIQVTLEEGTKSINRHFRTINKLQEDCEVSLKFF